MRPTRQKAIREMLKKHPYGLTRVELSEKLDIHISNIRTAIKAMPDVYVDRWIMGSRKQYQKIYCVVVAPEDCPHPKDRVYPNAKPATVWRQLQA
jgi:hypothetical protein